MADEEAGLSEEEMLLQEIAEQFYGGYCEPIDRERYEWQQALDNARQIIQKLRNLGWKSPEEIELMFNPDYLDFKKGVKLGERQAMERVFEEIEHKAIHTHGKGDSTLTISYPKWQALKSQLLKKEGE